MRLRDRLYSDYLNVFVVSGLRREVIDSLPAALVAFLAEPGAQAFRDFPGYPTVSASLPGAISRAVATLPDGAPAETLIAETHRRGPQSLPFTVTSSGDSIAVGVPHAVADGAGALAFLRYIISAAAGAPIPFDDRTPLRWALIRAIAKIDRKSIASYRTPAWHVALSEVTPPQPCPSDLELANARLLTFAPNAELMKRISGLRDPDGASGRSTANIRLSSLILAALAQVYRGTADLPVVLPLDLRRYVDNHRVDGNFIHVGPVGTLLTTSWSPSAIGANLAARLSNQAPVVAVAHTSLRWVVNSAKAALRSLLRISKAPAGQYGISVSMLTERTDFPAVAWAPGAEQIVAAATISAWPSSTLVFITTMGRSTRASVWDESGLFDLDRLADAFTEVIESRSEISQR